MAPCYRGKRVWHRRVLSNAIVLTMCNNDVLYSAFRQLLPFLILAFVPHGHCLTVVFLFSMLLISFVESPLFFLVYFLSLSFVINYTILFDNLITSTSISYYCFVNLSSLCLLVFVGNFLTFSQTEQPLFAVFVHIRYRPLKCLLFARLFASI